MLPFGSSSINLYHYEKTYYQTFLVDWDKRKESLIEEFERVNSALLIADFQHPNWHNVWFNNRPKNTAVDIANAIMFMTRAGFYLQLRLEQVNLRIENCKDVEKWADLSQRIHVAFESMQAASNRDARILVETLGRFGYMSISRGEFSRFEVSIL